MAKEWFEDWFNSPFYHKLYQNHDSKEACLFVDNLFSYFNPSVPSFVLDLACGKGRFSNYISEKGHIVTGLDLSEKSIEIANQKSNQNLEFYCHDMRFPFRINYYDFVFNFFTSFGYFAKIADNIKTLKSVNLGIKKGGYFVLDFFNSEYIIQNLVKSEVKVIDGTRFEISKWIEDEKVFKKIDFLDGEKSYTFTEKVQLLKLADFQEMFKIANFEIIDIFGDYDLNPFDKIQSKRLIIISKKVC